MMKIALLGSVFALLAFAEPSAAQDCNFDKAVGVCTATISIDRSGGSKPSYSAEITIRSSASACSKVEWYLDSTSHRTVLGNSSSDTDSVFGTNPITKANFKIQSCTVFERGKSSAASSGGSGCGRSIAHLLQRDIETNKRSVASYAKAKKYLADELARKTPDQAYLQQVRKYLADNAQAVEKAQSRLNEDQACLANRKCYCRDG